MKLRTRGARLLALVIAGSLFAAACSDDDDPTTDAAEETTDAGSEEEAVEGEEADAVEPASGEPITIGFVNMEDGPLAQPTIGAAAEAARQMINANGGINGRPLEFEKCSTNGAPDSSAQCANQLVAAGVPAAYQGLDFGNAGLHPILADAGIPWVGQEPFTPPDYQSGYFFSGSQVSYGLGAGIYLRDELQPERVTIMSYPSPTAQAAIENYLRPAMEAGGASVEVVNADFGAPDMSVPVGAAIATDPDVIIFFMADADCTAIITAADQLGYDGTIIAGNCGSFVKDAGAAAEGVYALADVYSADDLSKAPERPASEVEAYVDAMAEYAPDVDLNVFSQFVFAGVVNLATVLGQVEGEVTAESVTAALEATEDVPAFMGNTFGCAGELTDLAPSICGGDILVLRSEGGKLVQLTEDFLFGPSLFE
ncbi:MAG TPA: ABC transporter substrate-binding protein [Acidimicrobiales bacterium]|nr:ABC transporter substrate-binding protein [Acidimicrobiales bacterium]